MIVASFLREGTHAPHAFVVRAASRSLAARRRAAAAPCGLFRVVAGRLLRAHAGPDFRCSCLVVGSSAGEFCWGVLLGSSAGVFCWAPLLMSRRRAPCRAALYGSHTVLQNGGGS